MQNRQKIVAIAGPSCGGKTTLKNALVEGWPGSFAAILTTTTRPKRPGEKEGRDYHFVSPRQFNSAAAAEQFVETLVIGEYVYGLSLAALTGALTGARNGVVVITPDGLPALQSWCDESNVELISVFATAPLQVLYERLCARHVVCGEGDFEQRREWLETQVGEWRDRWHFDIQAMNG